MPWKPFPSGKLEESEAPSDEQLKELEASLLQL